MQIKAVLFKPVPVALALVVGGLIILWAESRKHVERVQDVDAHGPSMRSSSAHSRRWR